MTAGPPAVDVPPAMRLAERDAVARRTLAQPVPEPVVLPLLEGAIPPEIEGMFLRNGPGRLERGGVRYGHLFDGDGFLQQIRFEAGAATYRARWVETREWREEEAAGEIRYRGFGTNRPGGLLRNALRVRFKNAANTSIVIHAGRALALWEGGLPHAFDLESLRTLGRYDFAGGLRNPRPLERQLNPELPFAAHPQHDPETGELWGFGAAYGLRHRLLVHRVTPDGALRTRAVPLDRVPFVHDFVLTRRWCVFFLASASFDMVGAVLGTTSPAGSLHAAEGASSRVLLVPRDGGPPVWVEGPEGFVFHWAHGREVRPGYLELDGMRYPSLPTFGETEAEAPSELPRPARLAIDVARGHATFTARSDWLMELPRTTAGLDEAGATVWAAGAPPGTAVPVLPWVVRLAADGSLRHRALFPDLPEEPLPILGGAYVLLSVFRADRTSEVWILDGTTLATVARLGLPHAVPPALHGIWVSGASASAPPDPR